MHPLAVFANEKCFSRNSQPLLLVLRRSFRKGNHPFVLGLIKPGQITIEAKNRLRFEKLLG